MFRSLKDFIYGNDKNSSTKNAEINQTYNEGIRRTVLRDWARNYIVQNNIQNEAEINIDGDNLKHEYNIAEGYLDNPRKIDLPDLEYIVRKELWLKPHWSKYHYGSYLRCDKCDIKNTIFY
jgi:hypothetical protein